MTRTWRLVVVGLALSGGSLAWLGVEMVTRAGHDWLGQGVAALALLCGFIGLWLSFAGTMRHFRALADLTRAVGAGSGRVAPAIGDAISQEVGRLAEAIDSHRHPPMPAIVRSPRATALAAIVDEPLLVVDARGTITLSNTAALRQLGVGAQPGSDIRDLFHESEWAHAIERVAALPVPVPVFLHRLGGAMVCGRAVGYDEDGGVALALAPPAAQPRSAAITYRPADDEPVVTLALMAVWAAASTPDLTDGRMVALGCMRLSGPRIFRTMSLDLLLDPGEAVSPQAVARHGIDSALLRGARTFADAWTDIERMLRGCILVGVGIEAIAGLLRREASLAGVAEPPDYPLLELGLLADAADGRGADRPLERLCADFCAERSPRFGPFAPLHALGEIVGHVVQRLPEHGVVTFADAWAIAGRSAGVVVERGVDDKGGAKPEEQR